MAGQINLGGGFTLPPRVVTQALAIFGTTGSGKTNTGGLLFEQMFGIGAQSVVLDPVGNWFSLRLSASGKRRGLDIPVFGGDHGDVPITAAKNAGRMMAKVVAEKRVSCVIDLSNFKPQERQRFSVDFAEELFHLMKKQRRPLHLFLDEARLFAPKQMRSTLDSDLVGAFEPIVRLGRNYGLGVTLMDQRPQSVHNEVSSQTKILIVHQLIEKEGRKSIEDWIRARKTEGGEALEEIDTLQVGQAIIWAPGTIKGVHRVKVDKKTTYDASKTPELGDAGVDVKPMPLTAKDLSEIAEAMKEVVEEAEANDPTKLRQEVQRLRAQVVAAESRPAPSVLPKEVAVQVIDPKLVQRLEALAKQVTNGLAPISDKVIELGQHLSNIGLAAMKLAGDPRLAPTATSSPRTSPTLAPASARRAPSIDDVVKSRGAAHRPGSGNPQPSDGELTGPELRILGALAWLASIGVHEAEITTVAFLAKYRIGGAFNNPKSRLRGKGLLDYPSSGTLRLTAAGAAKAPRVETPLTTAVLHEHVMACLKGPEQRVLAPLLNAYPNSMTLVELAKAAGYEIGGAFNNPKSRLRSLGLAVYPTSGTVRAADRLFLER